MTARDIWDAMGVELNKVQAPSLLIEDYNYLINKAVNQYINRNYNMYDLNQQMSDNLRVLKSTTFIKPVKTNVEGYTNYDTINKYIYEVELPVDYLHILNCIITFKPKKTFKNYDCGVPFQIGATRLTSDMWSQVITDAFNRPSYKRPYFFIHNVNPKVITDGKAENKPGNPYTSSENGLGTGTDPELTYNNGFGLTGLSRHLYDPLKDTYVSNRSNVINSEDTVNKLPGYRYGNASTVRMELRFGKDDIFEPVLVQVDYLKAPQTIRLTQQQIETTEDTSQVLEFPDYVCQEIINGLVSLVMENIGSPRLATNAQINQTIAPPAALQQSSK